jgi:hypothetical protein
MSQSILSPLTETVEALHRRGRVAETVATLTDLILADGVDWRQSPTLEEFKSLLAKNLRARAVLDGERDAVVTVS